MAVLSVCERVIRRWPVAARIAFRDAVMSDVSQFLPDEWDPVAAMLRAEMFYSRWERGLPWPPDPNALAVSPPPEPVIDRDAIRELARRICALGVELARLSR